MACCQVTEAQEALRLGSCPLERMHAQSPGFKEPSLSQHRSPAEPGLAYRKLNLGGGGCGLGSLSEPNASEVGEEGEERTEEMDSGARRQKLGGGEQVEDTGGGEWEGRWGGGCGWKPRIWEKVAMGGSGAK